MSSSRRGLATMLKTRQALEAFEKAALQPNWKKFAPASRKALRQKSGSRSEPCHAIGPSDNGERARRSEKQDHAYGGRSAGHVHQVWASAPHDQRTTSAWIFGAICPAPGKAAGKGAGLVLPFCNTDAMNLHLVEIARTVAPGAHAVLLMDQAGWHMTAALIIPENISIIPLSAKCPERWSGRKYLAVHAG